MFFSPSAAPTNSYNPSSSNIVVDPSRQGHKLFKMIVILSSAHNNIKKFNFTWDMM